MGVKNVKMEWDDGDEICKVEGAAQDGVSPDVVAACKANGGSPKDQIPCSLYMTHFFGGMSSDKQTCATGLIEKMSNAPVGQATAYLASMLGCCKGATMQDP